MKTAMQDFFDKYVGEVSKETKEELLNKEKLQIQRAYNIGMTDADIVSSDEYYNNTFDVKPKIEAWSKKHGDAIFGTCILIFMIIFLGWIMPHCMFGYYYPIVETSTFKASDGRLLYLTDVWKDGEIVRQVERDPSTLTDSIVNIDYQSAKQLVKTLELSNKY